jgi:AcrR family transcriptional regulator
VLDAAAELALEGATQVSVDAIAARAGVSRTTIYKWWPSAPAVMLEGLLERTHETIDARASASTEETLHHYLASLVALLRESPVGSLLRGLIAASVNDSDVGRALVDDWLEPRRIAVKDLLDEGVRRGEVRADLDYEIVSDTLFGPIYYRLMLEHRPLDDGLPDDILRACWPGIAV